jgi:transcriptional regulator with XRE-family HTH domain
MRTARNVQIEMALQQRAMGRRIAEMRERRRLTQEAAADLAGVTLRAYQKWEAGGGIQYANLSRLAEVFHVPVDRITGEESAPDPFATASQLDRIEQQVTELRAERETLQEEIGAQNRLLAEQSGLLKRIEELVRVLEGAQVTEPGAAEPDVPLPEFPLPSERDAQEPTRPERTTRDPDRRRSDRRRESA